jgi:hypothetical protein
MDRNLASTLLKVPEHTHSDLGDKARIEILDYSRRSTLLSAVEIDGFHADVRLDFTGDFGHEVGMLKIAINPDGLIDRVDAYLE